MKTIQQIADQIIRMANTGREHQINESLHFGMGLYAYKEDVEDSVVPFTEGLNSLFGHLENERIESFLSYLLNRDGYLALS